MSFVNGSHRLGVLGNYRTYQKGEDLLDIYPNLRNRADDIRADVLCRGRRDGALSHDGARRRSEPHQPAAMGLSDAGAAGGCLLDRGTGRSVRLDRHADQSTASRGSLPDARRALDRKVYLDADPLRSPSAPDPAVILAVVRGRRAAIRNAVWRRLAGLASPGERATRCCWLMGRTAAGHTGSATSRRLAASADALDSRSARAMGIPRWRRVRIMRRSQPVIAAGLRRLIPSELPLDFIGFSFGGVVGAYFAAFYPELARTADCRGNGRPGYTDAGMSTIAAPARPRRRRAPRRAPRESARPHASSSGERGRSRSAYPRDQWRHAQGSTRCRWCCRTSSWPHCRGSPCSWTPSGASTTARTPILLRPRSGAASLSSEARISSDPGRRALGDVREAGGVQSHGHRAFSAAR